MRSQLIALLVALVTMWPMAAVAGTEVDLIGDKDGFGIGAIVDEPFQPGTMPGYDGPGDGDGTDKWAYGSRSIVHYYLRPASTVVSAQLEVFTGGQGYTLSGGGVTTVFLNGTSIGTLTDGDIGYGGNNNIARRDVFDLTPYLSLLTGSDTVYFQSTYSGDGWVLDYSELTLVTASGPTLPSGIYWTDIEDGTLRSAQLDGSSVTTLLTGLSNPQGLAERDGFLFWTDRDDLRIRRVDGDGTGVQVILNASPGVPRDLVVTDHFIYWTNTGDGTDSISRVNRDGTDPVALVTAGLSFPSSLAVTDAHIYWSDSGTGRIQRSDLSGANVVDILAGFPGTRVAGDLIVTDQYLYWGTRDLALTQGGTPQPGTIQRAKLDGTEQVTLVDGLVFPQRLALAGGHLYWADQYTGKIQRAKLDGTEVTDLLVGLTAPVGLVVAAPAVTQVVIDIKPGGEPNAINPGSQGVVPVAILTTAIADGDAADFDASQVDPDSVAFGPAGARPVLPAKVADVDADGDLDLLLHFATAETGIACGDVEARLVGETYGGQSIEGGDSLITRGCGK